MLWGKLKKSRKKMFDLSNDSRKVSEDFNVPSKMPYITDLGGVTPLDYQLMKGLENLPRAVAEMSEEMLENIQFDEYNDGSFLDQYIDLYIGLAKNDLERQRIHHAHVIEGLKIIEDSRLLYYARLRRLAENTLEECQTSQEKGEQYEIKKKGKTVPYNRDDAEIEKRTAEV
jgi:hypothetical protein